jgi:hypothetical protein
MVDEDAPHDQETAHIAPSPLLLYLKLNGDGLNKLELMSSRYCLHRMPFPHWILASTQTTTASVRPTRIFIPWQPWTVWLFDPIENEWMNESCKCIRAAMKSNVVISPHQMQTFFSFFLALLHMIFCTQHGQKMTFRPWIDETLEAFELKESVLDRRRSGCSCCCLLFRSLEISFRTRNNLSVHCDVKMMEWFLAATLVFFTWQRWQQWRNAQFLLAI